MPVVIRPWPAPDRSGRSITSSPPTAARRGALHQRLGYFNPLLPKDKEERLKLDMDKVKSWMVKGARPNPTAMRSSTRHQRRQTLKRNNPERAIRARAQAVRVKRRSRTPPGQARPRPTRSGAGCAAAAAK
jgi:small subunit ribosomal protein S16